MSLSLSQVSALLLELASLVQQQHRHSSGNVSSNSNSNSGSGGRDAAMRSAPDMQAWVLQALTNLPQGLLKPGEGELLWQEMISLLASQSAARHGVAVSCGAKGSAGIPGVSPDFAGACVQGDSDSMSCDQVPVSSMGSQATWTNPNGSIMAGFPSSDHGPGGSNSVPGQPATGTCGFSNVHEGTAALQRAGSRSYLVARRLKRVLREFAERHNRVE